MEAGVPSQSQAQLLHMQSFSPENVAHNAKQIYYVRSVLTSVAGSAAGIFGLTNLAGFYFYFVSLLLTNLAIFVVNVQFQPRRYLINFNQAKEIKNGKLDITSSASDESVKPLQYLLFLVEGAQEMAFGYVLWWTLWFAIIHVYD
ncbi:hypothetical protein CBS101457_005627 [Exobasidium rhododendri]|nr:hypothetical protein CBS101457_005627 [Exobasidium rhododendri]